MALAKPCKDIPGTTSFDAEQSRRGCARCDDLFDGREQESDVSTAAMSMNGIELQDRGFFAAVLEGRDPDAGVAQVLPCCRTLHALEQQLAAPD